MDILSKQLYIKQILRCTESALSKRHIPFGQPHSRDSFVVVLEGVCVYTLSDGSVHRSQPGDVMYLAKGQDYAMDVPEEEYRYIVCDFRFAQDFPRRNLFIRPKNPPVFQRLFRKLRTAFSVSSPDRIPRCMALLYEIYSLLIQDRQTGYVPGSARSRIEEARAHIQERITDPDLSVAALAKAAAMSEVHFRKLFTELYGVSPSKYILQERISYARQLMSLRELRLEDIAFRAGFSSLPHFHKAFKATVGTTPAAYRKKLPDKSVL